MRIKNQHTANIKLSRRWFMIFLSTVILMGMTMTKPALIHALSGYSLVWSDEFNGVEGSVPDSSKWAYDVGSGCPDNCGWGNNELEYYTDKSQNAFIGVDPDAQDGEALIIRAISENSNRACDGNSCYYTSARLLTKGKYAVEYGRIEIRAKIPGGQGTWPAFWMLGDDPKKVGWPQIGEIDIMETVGSELTRNHGTIHGPSYSAGLGPTGAFTLPDQAQFNAAYHTFAIDWAPNQITWYVDDSPYEVCTSADVKGHKWVFDHPFYLLLNLAIGGDWPGNPDRSTVFPQELRVDYVRVYQKQPNARVTNTPATPTLMPQLTPTHINAPVIRCKQSSGHK